MEQMCVATVRCVSEMARSTSFNQGTVGRVSYHKSAQKDLKIGASAAIMPMQLDPTEAIVTEESPWFQSFENFSALLPYKGEPADDIFEIELLPIPYVDTIALAQIGIGRAFNPEGWTMDGVDQVTVKQEIFPIP